MRFIDRLREWYRHWITTETATRQTSDGAVASGRIEVGVYDPAVLRYHIPWWDALSKAEKLQELKHHSPVDGEQTPNTTCIGLDELRVDSLDEAQEAAETATECAVGTDGTTTPAYSDTSLSNEVYRADISSTEDQGTDLYTSTFLSTNEANGNDLAELGLHSSDGRLLNHSTFTAVTKTSSKAVTLEVTLSFSSA